MAEKINKHKLRTQETRELLLRSAEQIFVRDGYEKAELGEIAAIAGRTKGSIYAHFKSKEDIFLALIEQRMTRYRAQMAEMLAQSTSVEENLATLRKFYLNFEDEPWSLLVLESKLYALRHPESKERLQKLFDAVISASQEKRYVQILGSAGKGKDAIHRSVAVKTLSSVISALVIETRLSPDLFDEKTLKQVTNRIFDALLPPAQ